jgi:flavin-dependent dehydrogenase
LKYLPNVPSLEFDVAVIGGGPAGSSYAALLKKYAPQLKVGLFERETFPREHIGESLLPIACRVLDEMGCWDAVEAANFPVKIGATYRWGSTKVLWDFDFLEGLEYEDKPRPAKFEGHRRATAFQVDRAPFDTILLNQAKAAGAEVSEDTRVIKTVVEGRKIEKLVLEDGSEVTAKLYIDASGHSGILRRAVGIDSVEPSPIRNVAVWGYWDDAPWSTKFGDGATRVLVLSVGYGWIWHIPISETRASIGLVLPVDYLKSSGKSITDLYWDAIAADAMVQSLLLDSKLDGELQTTSDWSFVAETTAAENWILVGESAGFADPILAAGISMAMVGASDAAALTIAWLSNNYDRDWLMREYDRHQQRRIRSHIHFADYWYTANAQFTDLVDFTKTIAGEAGLTLDGKSAWRWLGTGGFLEPLGAGIAGFGLPATHWFAENFEQVPPDWSLSKFNRLTLNVAGSQSTKFAIFRSGQVVGVEGWVRGNRSLYVAGVVAFLLDTLSVTDSLEQILERSRRVWCARPGVGPAGLANCVYVLEALLNDGWIEGRWDAAAPKLNTEKFISTPLLHKNSSLNLSPTN